MLIGETDTSQSFILPPDAVTQKFAFLARSGAGKTYAATKLAELFYRAGMQFVALDPVGVWYGLRLQADGIKAGLPIPVFGGEYGDIPLEPGAGALVADVIVDRGISLVLDVSGFRKAQRREFVTAFAEQLFHRKKTARSPLHLFLEESQFFVPQKTFKGEERMLGAFEDLGKVGRNYGIGLSLISQRPQAVNKDVLNQVEALFVLQMNAAQERKAIRDWIDAQGIDAGAAVDQLPLLEIGEAYVWSPQWLKFFGKVKIGRKQTYNASATPTTETVTVTPRPLKADDLAALREAMREVVMQVEAKDPTALRRRIAELERDLQQRQPVIERVEVPVISGDELQRLEDVVRSLADLGSQIVNLGQGLASALAAVQRPTTPTPRVEPPRPVVVPKKSLNGDTPRLRAGERRILEVLARRYPVRVTRAQLGTLTGFAPSGGTFGTYFGVLKRADLVEEAGGEVQITQAGFDYLGYDFPPEPQTMAEVLDMWRSALRAGERKMLDVLIEAYPANLSRDELGERTGFTVKGGTFGTYLGTLRRNGLAEVDGDRIRAGKALFL